MARVMHKAALVFQNTVKQAVTDDIELYDRAKVVRETIESPGWAFMVQLLEEQRQHLEAAVYPTGGVPLPTRSEYAAIHGQIAGIDQALHVAECVIELAERADQKNRQLVAAGTEE